MPPQIRPENGEVRCLVELDAEIEEPRAIGPIAMKQHNGGRSFSAAQQPAARRSAITIAPGFVCCLQTRPTDLRKGLRGDQVSSTLRPGDVIENPTDGPTHR